MSNSFKISDEKFSILLLVLSFNFFVLNLLLACKSILLNDIQQFTSLTIAVIHKFSALIGIFDFSQTVRNSLKITSHFSLVDWDPFAEYEHCWLRCRYLFNTSDFMGKRDRLHKLSSSTGPISQSINFQRIFLRSRFDFFLCWFSTFPLDSLPCFPERRLAIATKL